MTLLGLHKATHNNKQMENQKVLLFLCHLVTVPSVIHSVMEGTILRIHH